MQHLLRRSLSGLFCATTLILGAHAATAATPAAASAAAASPSKTALSSPAKSTTAVGKTTTPTTSKTTAKAHSKSHAKKSHKHKTSVSVAKTTPSKSKLSKQPELALNKSKTEHSASKHLDSEKTAG